MTHDSVDSSRNRLIAQLDTRQDRMLYTYRTQEKAADKYERWDARRRWSSLALTTLTAGTLVVAVVGLVFNETWGNLLVAVIATLATLVSFIGDYFDFSGRSQAHAAAGVRLRLIHNRYESLINDLESSCISVDEGRRERDELQKEEATLLVEAPRTTRHDYTRANVGIQGDEKPSSTQEEIDGRTPGRVAEQQKDGLNK